MKKRHFRLLNPLTFSLFPAVVSACPFCSENLAKNTGGFAGGLTLGIVITIFFMLGMIGSVAGFIAYLMVKEGRKSDRRHEMMAQSASQTSHS